MSNADVGATESRPEATRRGDRLVFVADAVVADVGRHRHVADERLDAVLGHMQSIDAHASGVVRRGSVLTVIADAVAEFRPDHMLIALSSPERRNWQDTGCSRASRNASRCRS
jgi:hypothetical protein